MDIWVWGPHNPNIFPFQLAEDQVQDFAKKHPDCIYFFAELESPDVPVREEPSIEWDMDANLPMYTRDWLNLGHGFIYGYRVGNMLYHPADVEIIRWGDGKPRIPRLSENSDRVLTSSQIWVLEDLKPSMWKDENPRVFTGNEEGARARAELYPERIYFFEEVN